ncbi:MAG: hypothetical protein ACJA0Y_002396 [Maricaulis maris]|jgi:hypothetical protein
MFLEAAKYASLMAVGLGLLTVGLGVADSLLGVAIFGMPFGWPEILRNAAIVSAMAWVSCLGLALMIMKFRGNE